MKMSSMKMKIAGILAAVVAVGGAAIVMLNGGSPDWAAVASAVVAAVGLFMARQNNVSSEDAGVK